MGREVRGESSSSRNANTLTVTRISKRGTGGERYTLSLSDGSSFFISASLLVSLELHEGLEISEEDLERIRFAVSLEEAKEKALSLLARREHSRGQLRLKLMKREYSEAVIDTVLTELESRGLLSNLRFAEQWVRSRLARHPEGRVRLLAGLLQRGVSRAEADQALDVEADEDVLGDAAERAAVKLMNRSGMTPIKLQKKLYSLGFSRSNINLVLKKLDLQ